MIKQVLNKGRVPVKIWTDELDSMTYDQLEKMSQLPFIHKWISVMPDGHGGKGSCVGSVIPTHKAIIPAAVGVDIGCGMMAVHTNLNSYDINEDIAKKVHDGICRNVPLGPGGSYSSNHKQSKFNKLEFSKVRRDYLFSLEHHRPVFERKILDKISSKKSLYEKAASQLGSLGGGNHFIEICVDEKDEIWIMLHSGSRGIGNLVGSHYIKLAKEDMERHFINLPDKDLAYLVEGSEYFNDYIDAMNWCQDYAKSNRNVMMDNVLSVLYHIFDGKKDVKLGDVAINCHHNYTEMENHFGKNVWVSRKGAIRAREGDLGIIPGSMGVKSFIVEGLGNADSFHSCSHGAGRKMSRSKAKQQFNMNDLKDSMKGIVCNIRDSIVDEIPSAYKDIDQVMENQKDLVKIKHTLNQIINVKGD